MLPPGPHEVVFSFCPPSLNIGICLSLAGLVGVMLLVQLDRRQHLRRTPGAQAK